ncbi:MAG: hypothetical protein AAF614_29305 [Chloroflexota bacterium]
MTNHETPNRLVITEEDIAPMVAEAEQPNRLRETANRAGQSISDGASRAGQSLSNGANRAGQAVSTGAKRAWDSDARRKVTGKVSKGVSNVANRSSQMVRDKVSEAAERQARATAEAVQTRIQETDWKKEAQDGTVRGLRWLSQQLTELADRFTPNEKSPPNNSN